MTVPVRQGATNSLVDVAGLRVGHYQRTGAGWLTGTTVVLTPSQGAVAGVDQRGGAPGTRETDLLDPRNAVERAHAILLSGGSAYGLAAATGLVRRLADARVGFRVGVDPGEVVPIVPGAVVFDLGRGGEFRATPDADFGAAAYDAATAAAVPLGSLGAATGAVAGRIKGGIGSASAVLDSGVTVAALAVVNAAGSTVDAATGELYGARFGLPGEFDALRIPDETERVAAFAALSAVTGPGIGGSFNTTIGVVATDASLTKAQCQKLAGVAQDGLARAIRPAHSMFDGDTVFALAVGDGDRPDPLAFNAMLSAAADTFSRAVVHGMLAATSAGGFRAYSDLFPNAVQGWRQP